MVEDDAHATYEALAAELNPLGLAYLHIYEGPDRDLTLRLRQVWRGALMLNPSTPNGITGLEHLHLIEDGTAWSGRRIPERGTQPRGGQGQRGRIVELGSLVSGSAKKLEAAAGPRPDESVVQGLALGRRHDVVPVAVSDQERRRAG